MKWLYFGGWFFERCTTNLKVEDGRLFGKRKRQWLELAPTDIIAIREYPGNNGFLRITTSHGDFHVGVLTRRYDDVTNILESYGFTDFCRSFTHQFNHLMYRKQFKIRSLVKFLFSRNK